MQLFVRQVLQDSESLPLWQPTLQNSSPSADGYSKKEAPEPKVCFRNPSVVANLPPFGLCVARKY